jgi:cell wall-associated NlpC family hydrolase
MGGSSVVFAIVLLAALVVGGKFVLGGGSGDGAVPTADAAPTGNDAAAILAEARKHDNESYNYGGGHPPAAYTDGAGLDCSGLIDVAVLRVTGINENNIAQAFKNSKHWQAINIGEAREGDIVYLLKEDHPGRSEDHVAIVVSNGGDGNLTVFEAATSQGPQPQEIRESSNRSYGEWDGTLRFHR